MVSTTPVANFLLAKLALMPRYIVMIIGLIFPRNGKEIFFQSSMRNSTLGRPVSNICNKSCEVGYRLEDDYSYNFSVRRELQRKTYSPFRWIRPLCCASLVSLPITTLGNHGGALGGSSKNGTSANISTVAANGCGTDDVDARLKRTSMPAS